MLAHVTNNNDALKHYNLPPLVVFNQKLSNTVPQEHPQDVDALLVH